MITKWLVLSVVPALCGWLKSTTQNLIVSRDGLGRDPNLLTIKRTRTKTEEPKLVSEAESAKLRPYSPGLITQLG